MFHDLGTQHRDDLIFYSLDQRVTLRFSYFFIPQNFQDVQYIRTDMEIFFFKKRVFFAKMRILYVFEVTEGQLHLLVQFE